MNVLLCIIRNVKAAMKPQSGQTTKALEYNIKQKLKFKTKGKRNMLLM